jgi:hypothetical protein
MKEPDLRLTMRAIVTLDQTWRFDSTLSPDARTALVAAAKAGGISCVARADERIGATYVLAAVPDPETGQEFAAQHSASATYEPPIIALAIEPQSADALPSLFKALGGEGAPAGIVGCERREDVVILEFTPSVTPWRLVRSLIDVELQRFASARKTTLLSPLTLQMQTQIVADGLDCAQIAPDRVLEVLIDADR